MAPWTARRSGDIVFIKTLLYTGVRVAELVSIRLGDVDLDACRIRITQGKGAKDRYVPFPATFKETLALHISAARDNGTAGPIPVTRPLPVRSGPAGGQQINAHSGTQPFPGTWRPDAPDTTSSPCQMKIRHLFRHMQAPRRGPGLSPGMAT